MRGVKTSSKAMVSASIAAATLLGCTSILGSFDVGPAGTSSGDTGDASMMPMGPGGGSDSSVPDGAGKADSAPPLMCKAGETKCAAQGVCAVLATDGANCGACGRSCGGGACKAGVCQPAKIYDGTLAVGPVAVGQGLHFFFATSDGVQENKVNSCLVATGCTVVPKQLVVRQYPIEAIQSVNANTLTFISAPTQTTQRPAIYACDPTGCPAAPNSFTGDGLNGIEPRLASIGDTLYFNLGGNGPSYSRCAAMPGGSCTASTALGSGMTRGTHGFAVDTTNIYFVDSSARGSTIAKCALSDTACVPTALVPGDQSSVASLAVDNGKLFWIQPGRDDFHEGKLLTCDLPACATVKLIAGGLDTSPDSTPNVPHNELRVDSTGAYWFTRSMKLQRCLPGGCNGGPRDLAGPLVQPHSLTADDSFVYWAEATSVWRVAK